MEQIAHLAKQVKVALPQPQKPPTVTPKEKKKSNNNSDKPPTKKTRHEQQQRQVDNPNKRGANAITSAESASDIDKTPQFDLQAFQQSVLNSLETLTSSVSKINNRVDEIQLAQDTYGEDQFSDDEPDEQYLEGQAMDH